MYSLSIRISEFRSLRARLERHFLMTFQFPVQPWFHFRSGRFSGAVLFFADFLCLYNSTGSGESDSSRADVPVVITYMAGSRSVQKKWKLPCQRCANFVLSSILRVFCDFLKTSLRWIFRSAWSNLVTIRLHVFWRDNNGRFKWKRISLLLFSIFYRLQVFMTYRCHSGCNLQFLTTIFIFNALRAGFPWSC